MTKIGQKKPARWRIKQWLIVLTGVIFFQSLLYGPSLIGQKILLPLDLLTLPGWYIPQTAQTVQTVPQDMSLSDLVTLYEPARQFSVSEIHHGRFPLWSPFQYGGVPSIWPKFSPFLLLEYTTRSPVILAWGQLVSALVAGTGMYLFCRRLLRVSFWPAAICAWLYPMTAFFIIWFGAWLRFPICWLPWLFVAIDRIVRRPHLRSAAGLSLVTCLVLISGNIDVAGQALLGGGIYAVWYLAKTYCTGCRRRRITKTIALLTLGWGLGFMLASPYLLPLLEYAQTGFRMEHRSKGLEERPPTGLAALPQIVLPDMYGTTANGSCFIEPAEQNLFESASIGYAGVIAALLVGPLAWFSRSHRVLNWFWVGLAFFGMSWCLDVPGLVQILRLPGLNMMSHNRLVFLTGFAVFALTATGLENIVRGRVQKRRWFWGPATLLAMLCIWCLYRSVCLPEPVATKLEPTGPPGAQKFTAEYSGSIQDVATVQVWFFRHYLMMAVFCGLGFAGWMWLWSKKKDRKIPLSVFVILLAGDLLWFDHGRCAQGDPALYYPKIPVLDEIVKSVPGRVVGYYCLPATMLAIQGLDDVKGYDSIDPTRMVILLILASKPTDQPIYAGSQFLIPRVTLVPPASARLSPLLNMLGVRYVIARGDPPPDFHPFFQSDDYCALINSNALPRAFVPRSVETVADDTEQLKALNSPQFDPSAVAYVPSPVTLPPVCDGIATITNEIPTHIMISVQMKTPGMVVLADRWDKGWHALWNGAPVNILEANYALRGVVLPAGAGTLEFIYRPASLVLGCELAAFAAVVLLGMVIISRRSKG